MKLTAFSSIIVSLLITSTQAAKSSGTCAACYGLAEEVEKKLKDTEGRANEEISIGVRIGADGESLPKTIVRYGDSDNRLHDILEGVCDANSNRAKCKEVLFKEDDRIASWFHDSKHLTSFANHICNNMDGCDANVAADLGSSVEVEVEDDKNGGRAKSKETISSPKQQQQQKAPKKAEPVNKEQSSSPSSKQSTSNEASNPVIKMVTTMANNVKNNFTRLATLSKELYQEVHGIVKAKEWSKLKTMAKDPMFYGKYWKVFLWFFIVIYFIYSLYETFTCKAAPVKAKGERRSTSSGSKSSRSTKSSGSGSKTKKEN